MKLFDGTDCKQFKRHSLSHALLAVAASTIFTSTSTHAENEQEVINLDTISVSAERPIDNTERTEQLSDAIYTDSTTRSSAGLSLTVKETPQSISVFSRQRMQDQNLSTLNDVLSQTSGISVKEYDSARQYYYSRGFEINTILIDGVPTLFDPGWGTGENSANTTIYEQVEIIKGATGLMSGSGNPSAAINLVRKRASSEEFTGTADLGLGSRNEITATLDLASGLNETGSVRGRAVIHREQQDSFRDVGDSTQNIIYATTEADLSDETQLTLGGSIQENINNGPTWGGIPAWYDDGTRTNFSRSKTTSADWAYWNTTHKNVFAEIKHSLNEKWDLNARYNYGTSDGESRLLYVFGNPNRATGDGITAYSGGNFGTESNYNMLDLFASGSYEMFGRDQEVSIGVSRSERHFTAYSAFATSVAPIGDFNEWDGTGYPEHIWGERFLYEEQTDTQTALYASTRINWTEQFSTIIGGRLTDLEIDRKAAAYNDAQVIEHNGIFTPYLGVLYSFNDTYTAYASYTEIFSPQNERSQSGEVLNPISGNSYELGLKAGFAEDQLLATVAVFKTLQDDLAAVDGTNTVSGSVDQAYKEAEGATSKGYEIELVGALTETWEVQLGWTKYEVEDAQGEKINTEQPRSIFKSYTRYQLPGALNKITVGGGINWESESYSTATNPVSGTPEKVQQEAFALVSLMAKYQITPEFSTQLNVDNLTDESYYTNIGTFGQIAYGSPRTLSLSAKYNF